VEASAKRRLPEKDPVAEEAVGEADSGATGVEGVAEAARSAVEGPEAEGLAAEAVEADSGVAVDLAGARAAGHGIAPQ
jgi:hypothetical protein